MYTVWPTHSESLNVGDRPLLEPPFSEDLDVIISAAPGRHPGVSFRILRFDGRRTCFFVDTSQIDWAHASFPVFVSAVHSLSPIWTGGRQWRRYIGHWPTIGLASNAYIKRQPKSNQRFVKISEHAGRYIHNGLHRPIAASACQWQWSYSVFFITAARYCQACANGD